MAKVKIRTTLRKALLRGAQYAAVAAAAIQTVPVPDTVGIDQKASVVFIIGLVGAIAKGIHNYKKTSGRAPFLGTRSGLVLLVAAGLALGGCITTTSPDGTTTTALDPVALSTAWDTWERLEKRKEDLERERAQADAQRQAEIVAELRTLEPELRRLAERLGVAVPQLGDFGADAPGKGGKAG